MISILADKRVEQGSAAAVPAEELNENMTEAKVKM
jgi:hypothetical protein